MRYEIEEKKAYPYYCNFAEIPVCEIFCHVLRLSKAQVNKLALDFEVGFLNFLCLYYLPSPVPPGQVVVSSVQHFFPQLFQYAFLRLPYFNTIVDDDEEEEEEEKERHYLF